MWLPSTSSSRDVLVKTTPNYNEQPLGANSDSVRLSKTSSPINSSTLSPPLTSDSSSESSSDSSSCSLNQPNAPAQSVRSVTINNPKEADMDSAVKNHETVDPSQINKLDRSDKSDCTSESGSLDGKSDGGSECERNNKSEIKADNKPEPDAGKLIDSKSESKGANKSDSRVDNKASGRSETKADRQPETKSAEKLEKTERRATVKSNGGDSAVDANNNLCDRTIDDDKADLKLTNKDEKLRNRDGELLYSNNAANTNSSNNSNNANGNNSNHSSAANTGGYMPKPHQCSVSTSYHVYSNGCGGKRMPNSVNSKSSPGMQSSPEQSTNSNAANSAPQSAYTPAHALNHPPPHLSAGPYTIYTTGHYSLNGQPTTILSIPQSATLGHLQTTTSTLVNQSLVNQSIGQPMVNQSTINQSLNQSMNQSLNQAPLSQPHTHLHHNHYHSNQTHQHPNSGSGHAPPHLHYHSASIQQTSYHPNYGHPPVGQQQQPNNQKNLIKHNSNNSIKSSLSSSVSSASSSLTSSTAVSSPVINCNNSKSSIIMNNSTTYTPAYTNCNSPASPVSHHNSLNCHPLAGQLPSLHNPTSNHQNKFTKIFVGGLPYHSTDKSLSKFFQAFGEIEEAVVITDRQTGKSRGYGFVSIETRSGYFRFAFQAELGHMSEL